MRKIIRFKLVALLTAMSLTTQAQEMDTLKVQKDSVVWNESLKEVNVVASSIRTEGDRTTAFITKEMRKKLLTETKSVGTDKDTPYYIINKWSQGECWCTRLPALM